MQKVHSYLEVTYYDYNALNGRTKRGLVDVVGDIAFFAFRVATQKDLNRIRESILKISETQSEIMHIVNESFTA